MVAVGVKAAWAVFDTANTVLLALGADALRQDTTVSLIGVAAVTLSLSLWTASVPIGGAR